MHKSRRKFISMSSAHSQKNEIEKRSLITLNSVVQILSSSHGQCRNGDEPGFNTRLAVK